eukprot:8988766-Pyramimonas_sp.AAC.1
MKTGSESRPLRFNVTTLPDMNASRGKKQTSRDSVILRQQRPRTEALYTRPHQGRLRAQSRALCDLATPAQVSLDVMGHEVK